MIFDADSKKQLTNLIMISKDTGRLAVTKTFVTARWPQEYWESGYVHGREGPREPGDPSSRPLSRGGESGIAPLCVRNGYPGCA
jgi:hypothetical protein